MNSLTKWWLDNGLEDKKLLEFLNDFRENRIVTDDEDNCYWDFKVGILNSYIPMGKTLPSNFYVHENATSLINGLFQKHVNADTLTITSVVEHEAVEKNLAILDEKGFDYIRLHFYNGVKSLNLLQVKQAIQKKQYKKAFVYIIGTQITTGEITPQPFYIKLRKYLESQGLEVVMVIDDVHGMYLVPRDYSIFDYVICTSHALIRRYDMGMMWSKTKEDFGYQYLNWLSNYTDRLDIMLERKDRLRVFSDVMQDEFIEYLSLPYVTYMSNSVQHIFSLKVDVPPRYVYSEQDWKRLADLEVRLETQDREKDNIFYIRMRASQYITFPELLEPALKEVKKLLDKVSMIKEGID